MITIYAPLYIWISMAISAALAVALIGVGAFVIWRALRKTNKSVAE